MGTVVVLAHPGPLPLTPVVLRVLPPAWGPTPSLALPTHPAQGHRWQQQVGILSPLDQGLGAGVQESRSEDQGTPRDCGLRGAPRLHCGGTDVWVLEPGLQALGSLPHPTCCCPGLPGGFPHPVASGHALRPQSSGPLPAPG